MRVILPEERKLDYGQLKLTMSILYKHLIIRVCDYINNNNNNGSHHQLSCFTLRQHRLEAQESI